MWNTVKLGDALSIARGGSPRPIKAFITDEDDGVNWIKIGDTSQGGKYIESTKEKIKPSGISRSRYVKTGDFLLSNSMSFGRPYILKTDGCIHDGWLVLSDYEQTFTADYLYYLLSSAVVQNQFEKLARGSTVRNLNTELVSSVVVSVPPLTEQQRIVAKLDKVFLEIDRATEFTKSKLDEGSAIYKSMARRVFFESPNKVPISAVAEIIMGQSPKGDTYNSEGKGVPLINGPVEFDRDDFGKSKSIKFTTAPTKFCEAGDTLLCVRGSTTGRMNIASEVSCIGRGVAALRAHEYQPWISYFIQASRDLIYSLGKGATFPNISAKQIGEIEIYNPSTIEKQAIVSRLEKARIEKDNLIKLSESKLEQLASLKSVILYQELQPPQSEAA